MCDTANPIATMIEGSSAGMRGGHLPGQLDRLLGPTGDRELHADDCVTRTLVAQYRRTSFLNFVYYTDYETLDPAALYNPNNNPPSRPTARSHYPNRGSDCGAPINFVTGDAINGPLHSEDTLAICGHGRARVRAHRAQTTRSRRPGASTEGQNGCSRRYTINRPVGTLNTTSPSLTPPRPTRSCCSIAQPAATMFTGVTTIVLNGATMTVTNGRTSRTARETVAFPTNGVVYVSTASAGCPVTYTPFTANTATPATPTAATSTSAATTRSSLTIASDNDIIINGNIYRRTTLTTPPTAPTGNELLGLVANDFVRVYHPVTAAAPAATCGSCGEQRTANGTGSLTNPTIYAAILAVNHSFIVDNYDCGVRARHAHVYGAIAQLFRGPVGTSGGTSISTGYPKNYSYDDRLADDASRRTSSTRSSAAWSVAAPDRVRRRATSC